MTAGRGTPWGRGTAGNDHVSNTGNAFRRTLCAQGKDAGMFCFNPTGSSGFAKELDSRLPGEHPATIYAWVFSASGDQRHVS